MESDDTGSVENHPCAECGQLLRLDLDTPIGLRIDGKPGPLCSRACALDNVRRVRAGLDVPPRCACGVEVALEAELLIRHGEIVGCAACEWTGAKVRHYMTTTGVAVCPARPEKGEPFTYAAGLEGVNCSACIDCLVDPEQAAQWRRRLLARRSGVIS